jgi:hypothetical protein
VLLWIALACVVAAALILLRLAVGDEEPDNAIAQEQEREPRRDPDAVEMRRAA